MPSFVTDVPALLLRLDPNPYHHGTLGAARSLGRAGVEVHALLGSARGPVNSTRFLHRCTPSRAPQHAGAVRVDTGRRPRRNRSVHHLVDFSPRADAQFPLFTNDTGLDVVRAQHLHVTGRAVPAAPLDRRLEEPRGGPRRIFVVENYALLATPRSAHPPGPAGAGRARGPVERAWFATDGPLPFAAMAAGWTGRRLGKSLRATYLRSRLRAHAAAAVRGRAGTAPPRPATADTPSSRPTGGRPVSPSRPADSSRPMAGAEGPPAPQTRPTPHTERRNPCTTS